jgi:hypothetical protein
MSPGRQAPTRASRRMFFDLTTSKTMPVGTYTVTVQIA